jgi:hypothetical protein
MATTRSVLASLAGIAAIAWIWRSVRRLNDPLDYASLDVRHEPRITTARFWGMHTYDAVSHEAGIAAIEEFSRLFQSSHLAEVDPLDVVRQMSRCRRRMHREFHSLRMWLPNDSDLERRLLAGIDETDEAMALSLADITHRFPETRLVYGAGMLGATVRSAGDTW